jgi:ABC-type nitrate/sulfonate/bicarbonate transport system permease component
MVVSELVGSSNGIGYQMNNASGDYDLAGLWADRARSASSGTR